MRGQALTVALAIVGLGCGGGGGSSAPAPAPAHPPGISNLTWNSSNVFTQGSGGGAQAVGFQFLFVDNGGDVTTAVLEGLGPSNEVTTTRTIDLNGTAFGVKAGSVLVLGTWSTVNIGTFNFRIHLVDAAGNRSNDLYSFYQVVAPDMQADRKVTELPTHLVVEVKK